MLMPVMHVGHMRVRMPHHRMLMKMRVRLARRVEAAMRMAVVLIVSMGMGMAYRLVQVLMLVMLGQMQPHPKRHQSARQDQLHRDRFAQRDHRRNSADEWRSREVGTGSRAAEVTQRHDKKREAHPVSEKAHDAGDEGRRDAGKHAADPQTDQKIERPRNESELDDLQRIGERNFARQIIVEAPGQAGQQ